MRLINLFALILKRYRVYAILLPLCFLFNSCAKPPGDFPDSDYVFEVTCSGCTINITNGNNTQTYDVYGFRSIPFNHYLPVITVSLWTNYDYDQTLVRFKGSGYNRILFDDFLYYEDGETTFQFNL